MSRGNIFTPGSPPRVAMPMQGVMEIGKLVEDTRTLIAKANKAIDTIDLDQIMRIQRKLRAAMAAWEMTQ